MQVIRYKMHAFGLGLGVILNKAIIQVKWFGYDEGLLVVKIVAEQF